MVTAKEEIFARIRSALSDVTDPEPTETPIPWTYGQPTKVADPVGLFLERVADYKAGVARVPAVDVPATLVEHLRDLAVRSVVLPAGIDDSWREAIAEAGFEIISDDPQLTPDQLDKVDAVVTAVAVGVAETGTFVMDHRADQGRRALTLVPDRHICVVRAEQIVTDMPEAIARLKPSVARDAQPLTFVSGPSATSDIELSRVEGVHGPRILRVIVSE